jgi:predicted membrane protein (TIGR00267 family)
MKDMPVPKALVGKTPYPENHKSNKLSDIILGGQDGLVNVLGVLLGVAAASQDSRIVIAGGLAATFAESISMAAVAYTSKLSELEFYWSEMKREQDEMREKPEAEKEEIRQIYRKKGFKGHLLEEVVKVITGDRKVWLETMMSDELNLAKMERGRPLKSSVLVGVSALAGSLVPLIPFFFTGIQSAIWISLVISAISLFAVGAVKATLTVGNWMSSGLQMAMIGMVSALAGYGIGLLFQVTAI